MLIKGRYEYDPAADLLGRGGFARVFRARDQLLNREVALKVFSKLGHDQYSVLAEIRKAIQLEHPNLLRYYDVLLLEQSNALGEAEELQIGVMEYANAGDLRSYIRAYPASPLLPRFLREVLKGLEYLHSHGIIHRDLKAQNILLVERNGELAAKISDFGISKIVAGDDPGSSSMLVGTIEYMAPEQFNPAKFGIDGKVGPNVDLWSFGVMVHELLTEATPFGRRDGNTTAEQIMAAILAPDLPEQVEALSEPYRTVVKKCLVANAKARIRSASELLDSLNEPGLLKTGTADCFNNTTELYPKASPSSVAWSDESAGDAAATRFFELEEKAQPSRGRNEQERNGEAAGKTSSIGVPSAVAASPKSPDEDYSERALHNKGNVGGERGVETPASPHGDQLSPEETSNETRGLVGHKLKFLWRKFRTKPALPIMLAASTVLAVAIVGWLSFHGDVTAIEATVSKPPFKAVVPPEAKIKSAVLGRWALDGMTCNTPVIFSLKEGRVMVEYAGTSSRATATIDTQHGTAIFRSVNGNTYFLDANRGLSLQIAGDKIGMTKCVG